MWWKKQEKEKVNVEEFIKREIQKRLDFDFEKEVEFKNDMKTGYKALVELYKRLEKRITNLENENNSSR